MISRFLIMAMAVLISTPSLANNFDSKQRKEIETIIRQYILDNPSIVFEAADKHQANESKKQDEDAKKVLKDRAKDIFENKNYSFLGNKSAKVTFTEFFDYNCGYCKHAYADLVKATTEDPNIKIVLIDVPILGPQSVEAAKWAIAAGKMGKYVEYHGALMNFQGPKDEENLKKMGKDLGLDPEKLKTLAADPKTQKQIDENIELFSALGLSGTPGFAVSDRLIRGAVDSAALKQIAKDVLEKK